MTTRTLSSHIAATSSRSFTHMVRLEPGDSLEFVPGNKIKFVPRTLDVPVGDTVWFYSLNGSFLLHNTTLEKLCGRLVRYGDDAYKHVIFEVNSTEPLWLIGSQNHDAYSCCPSSYFALNPGAQKNQFFHSIEDYCTVVVVSTSTLPDRYPPTTGTIVVNANGDVVTTLGI
jgi:plastocyanin